MFRSGQQNYVFNLPSPSLKEEWEDDAMNAKLALGTYYQDIVLIKFWSLIDLIISNQTKLALLLSHVNSEYPIHVSL